MRIRLIATVGVCAVGLSGASAFGRPVSDTKHPPREVPAELHLALDRSAPEADQVVESVDRISLWFTLAPQVSGTSIRLVPDGAKPLDLGSARVSDADDKLFILDVPQALPSGRYVVHWRAMAQDGHTVRGDFGFQVKAAR